MGIGLALVVGSVSSYLVTPAANPLLLFGGVALVQVAVVNNTAAYREREATAQATRLCEPSWSVRSNAATRGIVLSWSPRMGLFYPLVARAFAAPGKPSPGPYAVAFFFAIGLLISTVPANLLLMAKPLDGKPPVDGALLLARTAQLAHCRYAGRSHLVHRAASRASSPTENHLVGPAVSYSIGQGSNHDLRLLGSLCLARVCRRALVARILLLFMFIFFLVGLCAVALAPLYLIRRSPSYYRHPQAHRVVGSIIMDLVAHTHGYPFRAEHHRHRL